MATKSLPTRSSGVRRLLAEASELQADESTDYQAAPLEDDLFQWHFTIKGPGGDFEGGVYHGRMILPSEYPFKPPEIYMATPSGRFEVNKKICLSISSFHPETWQPSWGIRTALVALMAFFNAEAAGAVGSMDAPASERRKMAKASRKFTCSTCGFDASAFASPAAAHESESPQAVTATSGSAIEGESLTTSVAEPIERVSSISQPDPNDLAPPAIFPTSHHRSSTSPSSSGPPPARSHHQIEPTAPPAAAAGQIPAAGPRAVLPGQGVIAPSPTIDLNGSMSGGSPMLVDRAIMVVLLALLACIVNKIA